MIPCPALALVGRRLAWLGIAGCGAVERAGGLGRIALVPVLGGGFSYAWRLPSGRVTTVCVAPRACREPSGLRQRTELTVMP